MTPIEPSSSIGRDTDRTRVALGPHPVSAQVLQAVSDAGAVVVDPSDAQVLIWEDHSPDGLADLLKAGPDAAWVQLPSAGIEWLFDQGLYSADRTWTCAKGGAYSSNTAELAISMLLCAFRGMHTFLRSDTWLAEGGRPLLGAQIAVIGGGGTAKALIDMLAPFRVTIDVVRSHPTPMKGVRHVYGEDGLHEAISGADAVVLAVPLTQRTQHMIDEAALRCMKKDAWLINVARGRIVDTAALVDALSEARIGGAALDVTDPEPLPSGHALWKMSNVIITPHVANTLDMSTEPFAALVAENLDRWQRGADLLGLVDASSGY